MATETVPAGATPAFHRTDEAALSVVKGLTFTIAEDRQTLGLEAAWELDALRDTIDDLCAVLSDPDVPQHELLALRLKVRGLTVRMGQLASVVQSVLSDDDTTAALHAKLYGRAPAKEVARG